MKLKLVLNTSFFFIFCFLILVGSNVKSFAQTASQDTMLLTLFKDLPDSLIQQYDTIDVSYMKFAGYAKMDIKSFTGLRVHFDPDFEKLVNEKNIERGKNDYIVWYIPDGFILRRYKNELTTYTSESLDVERLGYKFSIVKNSTQVKNNAPATDTLVVFKSQPNGYMGYLVSDIKNMESNIKRIDSIYIAEIQQKKQAADAALRDSIDTALGKHKEKLFPKDELYLYAYRYRNYDLKELNKKKYKGVPEIWSTFLIVANTNDLDYVKGKIKEEYRDSVWFVKKVSLSQIYDNSVLINLKSGSDEIYLSNLNSWLKEFNAAKADPTKLKVYEKFDYWVNSVDVSKIRDIDFKLSFEFLERNNRSVLCFRTYFGKDSLGYYPIFDRVDKNQIVLNNEVYDERIDDINYKFAFALHVANYGSIQVRFSPEPEVLSDGIDIFSLDDLAIKQYTAKIDYVRFIERTAEIQAKQQEEEENKKLTLAYNAKYGKQYVDQALEGNIIIGMHEDLLELPLRLWSITSKSLVPGGYILYCKSMLDSSKRLTVKVLNKKVVYVKW